MKEEKEGRSGLKAEVDRLFAAWDRPDSPGCALAVIRNGQVIYKRGYGMANLEHAAAITPATVFHIASISKHFTVFAIHLLAAEGRLSVDDDVRRHLPELPDFGAPITLRHLILHTSGLRDQWDLAVLSGWRMEDVITQDDLLAILGRQRELNFAPGTRHLYCNAGYTLLAEVVRRVSGQSLREFTTARIFAPLGMASTHFHDDHRMVVHNRALSYGPTDTGFQYIPLSYANVGATSLFTTVEDFARWDRELYSHEIGGDAVWREMTTPGQLNDGQALSYAGGLIVGRYRGLRTIGHSGGDAGYRTDYVQFPDQQLSVVIFSNLASFSVYGKTREVAEIYLGEEMEPRRAAVTQADRAQVAVDPAALDACAGDYRAKPGDFWRFFHRDDTLWFQPEGGAETRLNPASEGVFFARDTDREFTFHRHRSGAIRRVTQRTAGGEVEATRVQRVTPTPEQLEVYTGAYYSGELDVFYDVVLRDGALFLCHRRGEARLTPTIVDAFQSDLAEVTFIRGRSGRVCAMMLDTGRVCRLRFARAVRPTIKP